MVWGRGNSGKGTRRRMSRKVYVAEHRRQAAQQVAAAMRQGKGGIRQGTMGERHR